MGAVLRLEYAITTARRRRGEAPPRWAFALADVSDAVEDGAAWLYERNQPPVAKQIADDHKEDEGKKPEQPPLPQRKPRVPWRLCAAIVLFCTAAWITMDQLSATSIAKYRLAQAFDPWRGTEEWAGANSGRGTPPQLVRARDHGTLTNVQVACTGTEQCRGWVLL
jgi:hypothetical protein